MAERPTIAIRNANNGNNVRVTQTLKEGTEIGSVNGVKLYAPQGGGGGETPNDGVLTIQKEGKPIGTFSANQSTNKTINVVETDPTVPSWAKQPNKPSYAYSEITDTPTLSKVATSGAYSDLDGTPKLSQVATSGSYNDLSDKPSIPTETTVTQILSEGVEIGKVNNIPLFAPQGTSGTTDYADLENKPQINSIELSGNKTLDALGIASKKSVEDLAKIVGDANQVLENLFEVEQANATLNSLFASEEE